LLPLLLLLLLSDPLLRGGAAAAAAAAALVAAAAALAGSRLKGLTTALMPRRTLDTESCTAQRRFIIFRQSRQAVLQAGNSSMMDSSHRAVTSMASDILLDLPLEVRGVEVS
jgi:hypothetical protein